MKRVFTAIKDIYEQVGEEEYNRINPYARMIASIKNKYPNAKINRSSTTTIVFGGMLVPMLAIYFDTQEVQ